MAIPVLQKAKIAWYVVSKQLLGVRRYPLVLMLEPLFLCNLRCSGCGKISHPPEVLEKKLTPKECIDAAEECGAPVVSVAGGEPLLHPDIQDILYGLTARRRFVYLCTNGLLVKDRLKDLCPSTYLTVNIHLDGLREQHDAITGRSGVFDTAVEAIGLLLSRGFRVTTNTTLYEGTTVESAVALLDFLASLGVEGLTIAPGFSYEHASAQDSFMRREAVTTLFRSVLQRSSGRGWRFNHSSLYLDFLAGNRSFSCTPWGNPTRNIFGWQRPCYLLDDGYAASFDDLMKNTDWEKYGAGKDPRCADCMCHCGFEPTAVILSARNPLKLLALNMRGIAR